MNTKEIIETLRSSQLCTMVLEQMDYGALSTLYELVGDMMDKREQEKQKEIEAELSHLKIMAIEYNLNIKWGD